MVVRFRMDGTDETWKRKPDIGREFGDRNKEEVKGQVGKEPALVFFFVFFYEI